MVLFSNNSPTVGWVTRLASRNLVVAEHFVQALTLKLKFNKTCPLPAPDAISDVPSRLFGSNPSWHCPTDASFLMLFNLLFPLLSQNSWTGFQLNSKVVMRVIYTLERSIPIWKGGADYQKLGITLRLQVLPRQFFGRGPISTDYPFWTSMPVPHGIRSKRPIWILW